MQITMKFTSKLGAWKKTSVAIGLIVCNWMIFKLPVELKETVAKVMAISSMFKSLAKLKEIVVKIISK